MSAPLDPSCVVPDRACSVHVGARTGSRLRQMSLNVTGVTECNSLKTWEEIRQVRH